MHMKKILALLLILMTSSCYMYYIPKKPKNLVTVQEVNSKKIHQGVVLKEYMNVSIGDTLMMTKKSHDLLRESIFVRSRLLEISELGNTMTAPPQTVLIKVVILN